MAINGRISVDAVFHDTDGTTSLKIVSLKSSDEYTTGKVAVVSGTVGTNQTVIATTPSTYRDASGSLVSFTTIKHLVAQCNARNVFFYPVAGLDCSLRLPAGAIASVPMQKVVDGEDVFLQPAFLSTSGTASYTLVIYGT